MYLSMERKAVKITILCVGKIKENFYREAIAEYAKRLSRYCKLEIIEVADEKTPDKASAALEEQIREREADRLLSRLEEGLMTVLWRYRADAVLRRVLQS